METKQTRTAVTDDNIDMRPGTDYTLMGTNITKQRTMN